MPSLPDRIAETNRETESILRLTCYTAHLPNMGAVGCDGKRSLRVNPATGEVVDTPVAVTNFSSVYRYRIDPNELGTDSEISAFTAAHNNNVHPRAVVFGSIG